MTGIYLQKCILVSSIVALPVAILWSQSGKVFQAMNSEPLISQFAQRYVQLSIISIVPTYLYMDISRFLYSQGIFIPSLVIQILLIVLYGGMDIYSDRDYWGLLGLPFQRAICDWTGAISLLTYALLVSRHRTWGGFSWQAFEDLREYLWLSGSSVVQAFAEFCVFQVIIILYGLFNQTQEQDYYPIQQYYALYPLYFGISIAASTQVGYYMGAQQPQKARFIANVTQLIVVGVGLILAGVVLSRYFSQIKQGVIPFLFLFQIVYSLQGTCSGILRGIGKQDVGAIINVIALYVIAIPFGSLLAFKFNQGPRGIWIGLLCGFTIQCIILSTYIAKIDFDKASIAAQSRVNAISADQQTLDISQEQLEVNDTTV